MGSPQDSPERTTPALSDTGHDAWLPGRGRLPVASTLLIGIAVPGGIGYFVTWQITTRATELGKPDHRLRHKAGTG